MKNDTKELNLEECVNKNYAPLDLAECKDCAGYNTTCPSYYRLKEYIDARPFQVKK